MFGSRTVLFAFFCLAAGCSTGENADAPPPPAVPPTSADASCEPADAGADAPLENPLASALDKIFAAAAAKDQFAGAVVVVDGGKTVLTRAYGMADRTAKTPNTTDGIFRVASVSKQFTASAILALEDDGKLATTDPVSKFFPEYPKENLEMDGVAVTLHHLLSQTSGLPDAQATPYFRANVWKNPIDPKQMLEAEMVQPLKRKPGESFEYLNTNYFLLGLVIERVSGKSYETFLRERLLAKAAMSDTGTVLPKEKAARAAPGWASNGKSFYSYEKVATFADSDASYVFGSGQIYSTVSDLAKWDRALVGDAVLSAASRTKLFAPNLSGYGYGWVLDKKGTVPFAWHNGALSPAGYSSFVIRERGKDRFVAYLANLDIDLVAPLEAKVIATVAK